MKKQIIVLIVIMIVIIGGCNNQASQQTGKLNRSENPSNIDQHVKKTNRNDTDPIDKENQNGEINEGETNNPLDDKSATNYKNTSGKEDNTSQSTNEPKKQVWLSYFDAVYPYKMINITNFPNEKPYEISARNFLANFISDRTLLNELGKEYYDILVTPSSEYLILNIPQEYEKYLKYDILSTAKKNFPNIDKFWAPYYDLGHNGNTYSVIYSLKHKKIIDLNEVKNNSDKEYIYNLVLDKRYFYVSSLNTIKKVSGVIFRNYIEDKVVIEGIGENKFILIFYDLIKGEKEDLIEIPDDSIYSDIHISQWNEDGTVYFSLVNSKNDASYKYDLHTKKLTRLGKFIYFPLLMCLASKKYTLWQPIYT